jgi:hypothetical protein
MSIGKKAAGTPTSPAQDHPESTTGEWCVRVSVSVAENVPAPILRTWIVVETFARDDSECWPGNKALAARLGMTIRGAQLAIESLDDHGILIIKRPGGNRRIIAMMRRTFGQMTRVEWQTLAARAERIAAGRAAVATAKKAERKAHRPKIRIVG